MRNVMQLALVGACLLASGLAQAAQVTFSPPSRTVSTGATFTMDVVGRGFAQTTQGGGVDVSFDPNRLRAVSVSVNTTTWEFFSQPGNVNNTTGRIEGIVFASAAGRSADFPIATITFEARSNGSSPLQVVESTLNPFSSGGQPIVVDFVPGSVGIGANVPISGVGIASLAIGLLGLGCVFNRRKS
jgi:hypothetical protein